MPKKPLSAYNIFFRQERPLLLRRHALGESQPDFDANLEAAQAAKARGSDALFQAASKTLANRWKALSKEDRTPFDDPAAELTKQYRAEKSAYEEQMVREAMDAARKASRMEATLQSSAPLTSEDGVVQGAVAPPTVIQSTAEWRRTLPVPARAYLPQQTNHLSMLQVASSLQNRQYYPMVPRNFGGSAPIAAAAFPSAMNPTHNLGVTGFLSRNALDFATQELLSQQLPHHLQQRLQHQCQQRAQQQLDEQLQLQLHQRFQHRFLADLNQLQRLHPSISELPAMRQQRELANAVVPPNVLLPQYSLTSSVAARLQQPLQPPPQQPPTPGSVTYLARVMQELVELERLQRAPG
jgi:hypothetical protein